MVRKLLLERPILVGGLGLAATLSLLGGVQDMVADSTTLASLMAAGAGLWWWRRQRPDTPPVAAKSVTPVEREQVEAAIATLQPELNQLQQELTALQTDAVDAIVTKLERQRQGLLTELDRTTLKVAIAGYPRSGKSTLQTFLAELSVTEATSALAITELAMTVETSHSEALADLQCHQDAV
ncbi:MAG: hypothetical protein AAF622_14645, partial [Cyanobacteria bacterium P01_C01_bin.147]